jgi:peptidoglycan/LPS O-acetylase OafA/YrhL
MILRVVTPTVIGIIFPSNPPAWSLFFEMIAGFAFLFLIKMHFNSLMKIVVISPTSVASFGVLFALCTPHGGVSSITINLGMATDVFLGGFPRVLFGFTLGICLHRFMEGDIILQRLSFFGLRTHASCIFYL